MTMWLLFFPTVHLACCLLLPAKYRKVPECFYIYKKHEKEFLNYYPLRYIISYEHPYRLPSTNCGKHHLPNNLSFKGLEIRAGWLVIKVLLTGSWVSMCVSQIRSMRDVWRAQRGLLVLSACSMGIWCTLELFYLIRQLIFLLQVCSNGKLYSTGQRDRQ